MDAVAKLFGVFLACLIGPVLLAWGLYEAARYVLMGAYWLLNHYWPQMAGTVLVVLLAYWAWQGFVTWLELCQVRRQQVQATRRLDAAYQQANVRMEAIARGGNLRKGLGQ